MLRRKINLNEKGFSHFVVPVLVFLLIGGIGTYLLKYTHAAAPQGSAIELTSNKTKCVDDFQGKATNGNKVDLWGCNKTPAQQWTFNGALIVNANGACLDNWGATKRYNAPIKMYRCNKNDPAQQWTVSNGQIINKNSKLCLDHTAKTTNGTQLVQYRCNGGPNQKWTIVPPATTGTPPPTGGGGSTPPPSNGGGGSSSGSSAFTVVGNTIQNASGQTVMIHGVDRPSMEWSCTGASVTNGPGPIPASDFTTMKSAWNANAVRIPMNQDFWLSGAAKHCASYQSNIATVVQNARAAGLIVILDLHWSDKGNLGNTSPGQQCMADQNSVTFWQQVAAQYKSDPNVWFELYNEPHDVSWSVWQNGGSACGYTTAGMQALYNAVRGTGANNIVIAGGTTWASQLNGVPKLNGTNIAYAIHLYWQSGSYSTSGWDGQIGSIDNTAPVISTEFGDQVCNGQPFDASLLSYFKQHKIGYTAWAWFVQGCKWPSLITNASGTCNTAASACAIQKDMQSYTSGS